MLGLDLPKMNGTTLPASIGKFQVLQFLGQGAMGRVYLGEDPHIGRRVAIKVMTTAGDDETRARFHNEAMAAGRLSHPNIVQVYEFGSFEEQPYLAMEYLEGERLDEWLRAERTLRQKLDVLLGLCRAVEHAHARGVLHRDIKPSNLQVLPDGSCKLMDFGIARLESSKLTATGMILGTPEFIAPEVLQKCAYSPQADCYAVGLVAYWTLSEHNPFSADSMHSCLHRVLTVRPEPLQALCPDLPEALCQVIDACLRKDPNLRPTSLQELMQALEAITLGSDPSLTATPTRVLQVQRNEESAPQATVTAGSTSATISAPPPRRVSQPMILAVLALLTVLAVAYWIRSSDKATDFGDPTSIQSTTASNQPPSTANSDAIGGDALGDAVGTDAIGGDAVGADAVGTDVPPRDTPANNRDESSTESSADNQLAAAEDQPQRPTNEPTEPPAQQHSPPATETSTPQRQEPPPAVAERASDPTAQQPADSVTEPEPRASNPATATPPPTPVEGVQIASPDATDDPADDLDSTDEAESALAAQTAPEPVRSEPSSGAAEPAPALTLVQVTPAAVRRGQSTAVVLSSSGFDTEPKAIFRRGNRETRFLSLRGVRQRPDGSLTGTLFVGKDAPLGLYTVTLRDDSGRESNAVQVEVRL